MKTRTGNEKLDLVKLRPEAFKAGREPALVTLEPANYLTLNGSGNPNEPAGDFKEAVSALYSVAYPLKMHYKAQGMDYKIAPLEALWWAYQTFGNQERDLEHIAETWRWRLMIMVPDYVKGPDLAAVKTQQLARKANPAIGRVELELVDEGLCVQVMHFGPYAEETRAIHALRELMEEAGLRACGLHHEIYFNAPGRTAPEDLKTLLRQPVRRVEEECTAEGW